MTSLRVWAALDVEWRLVVGFGVATAAAYVGTGTRLSPEGSGRAVAVVAIMAALAVIYRRWRRAPLLADAAETVLKLFAILLSGMLVSYPAAALGAAFPYRDVFLSHVDGAIGFDWSGYVAFVLAHPWLNGVLRVAYVCMVPQFFLAGIALVVERRRACREAFVVMTGFTLAVTLAVFVFMPAAAHQGGPWVAAIDYMRIHTAHRIAVGGLDGIVTFPSFHAEAACLFVWAWWRVRWARWPALALNMAVIASAPVDGFHYGIDVVAGIAVSTLAVALFAGRARVEGGPEGSRPETATE